MTPSVEPGDLLALAERVEAATGPDRELDIALSKIFQPSLWETEPDEAPAFFIPGGYTRSLDYAMALVPDGARVAAITQAVSYMVEKPTWYVKLGNADRPGGLPACAARTPALALTAAALRARALASEQPKTKDEQ